MKVPEEIAALIVAVEAIVAPVYLVGGSVRDMLLAKMPTDFDFATPLTPDEIEARIRQAGKRAYVVGKRFGTVGFRVEGQMVEVTTFRAETYQPGSRKPEVEFVDNITFDLSRRDFTINAMALRSDGHLIDPFGGQSDINGKLIRAVGKPELRFKEDPLRMLRAARFGSQLGFEIDATTELRAHHRARHILEMSKERWSQELDKLMISTRPMIGWDFLARTMLLNYMIPELAIQVGWNQDSPYHQLELWPHSLKTMAEVEPQLELRWAALLHDVGKPFVRQKNRRGYSNYSYHELVSAELVVKIGTYLRWPKDRIEAVRLLVAEHMEPGSPLQMADNAARFRP